MRPSKKLRVRSGDPQTDSHEHAHGHADLHGNAYPHTNRTPLGGDVVTSVPSLHCPRGSHAKTSSTDMTATMSGRGDHGLNHPVIGTQ
jgi:hypothetical protein